MFLPQWLRQLAQRWFPRGGNRRGRAGRVPAPTLRRVQPILEVLEERLSPAVYNYQVVALIGDTVNLPNTSQSAGTLTNLADASINNSGNVSFLGTLNRGSNRSPRYSGVDEATFTANGSVNLSVLSFTLRDFSFPRIDSKVDSNSEPVNEVIAQDKELLGSTLYSDIRIWQPDGTYGSQPYAEGTVDVSSGIGDYYLHPAISPSGVHVAWQD